MAPAPALKRLAKVVPPAPAAETPAEPTFGKVVDRAFLWPAETPPDWSGR